MMVITVGEHDGYYKNENKSYKVTSSLPSMCPCSFLTVYSEEFPAHNSPWDVITWENIIVAVYL